MYYYYYYYFFFSLTSQPDYPNLQKKKKKKKKTKKSWLSFGLPGFTFQNTCVEDCQLRTQPHITTTHNHTKDRNPLQGNPFTVTFPQDY